MSVKQREKPKLAPPGAGVPVVQQWVMKMIFAKIISKRTPREQTRSEYERIAAKIMEKAGALTPEQRNVPVLVPPQIGLEDSSRYWSVNQLLEHLMIVGNAIQSAVLELAQNRAPKQKADTAAVKPKHEDQEYLEKFRQFAPTLIRDLDAKLAQPGHDFHSPLKHDHPWFGPLDARQWYWLINRHQMIHYQQLKNIIAGLKS